MFFSLCGVSMDNLGNIYQFLPKDMKQEHFDDIIRSSTVRIERIISKGHTSPEEGWYDQEENEWVIVLRGAGKIEFEQGQETLLQEGSYMTIPKHVRHRVSWTDPDQDTIWLAVFYS